jgi:GxxExxY protein
MVEVIDNFLYKNETYAIIGACMEVHRSLGNGFLEAVYQEALSIEFTLRNIPFEKEKQLYIYYKDMQLSKKYIADFICYNNIVIELKATESIIKEHVSQLINYLHATNKKIGLLINFGSNSLEYKRIIV